MSLHDQVFGKVEVAEVDFLIQIASNPFVLLSDASSLFRKYLWSARVNIGFVSPLYLQIIQGVA